MAGVASWSMWRANWARASSLNAVHRWMKSLWLAPDERRRHELFPTTVIPHPNKTMKRIISIILGLLGVFVGLGIVLPALAKLKAYEAIPQCALLFLGLILMAGGVGGVVYSLVRRNA